MGINNGKTNQQSCSSYLRDQISCYRWRSDSRCNSFIPRVEFTNDGTQVQNQKFTAILLDQISRKPIMDFAWLEQILKETAKKGENQQIISFERMFGRLSLIEGELLLEQNLYVLNCLISGFEAIFIRFGKTPVDLENCFITCDGQVRAWVNSNPLNNYFEKYCPTKIDFNVTFDRDCQTIYKTEMGVIKQVLRVCEDLSQDERFWEFTNEISHYLEQDILHRFNFCAVRKFINLFIYKHRIVLPSNLLSHFKQSLTPVPNPIPSQKNQKFTSSLSDLVEGFNYVSQVRLIKQAHIQQDKKEILFNQHENNPSDKQRFIKHNTFKNQQSEPTDSNDKINTKQSSEQSIHSSQGERISIASSSNHYEHYEVKDFTQTPKKSMRKMFDSTLLGSQHKTKSKVNKTTDWARTTLYQPKIEKQLCNFMKGVPKCENQNSQSIYPTLKKSFGLPATRMHSRQSSYGNNYTSQFATQTNEDHNRHYSYIYPSKDVSCRNKPSFDQSILAADQQESNIQGRKRNESNYTRKMTELFSSKDCKLYQSVGSLQSAEAKSIENSIYNGKLASMARSVKLLYVPTDTRMSMNSLHSHAHYPHHLSR